MALSRADLKILKTKYFPTNGRQLVNASDARKFFDAIIESAVNTVDDGTTIANVNADWLATSGAAEILNKPSTFTPSSHTHIISAITGLQDALDLLASIIYVDGEIDGLQTQIDGITTLLNSDNINLDTIQEIVDAIEDVQTWIATIIINDLTTGGTTKALSAQQGVVLKGLIDTLTSAVDLNTTHRGLTNNPHSVTKAQVGLSNVDNTSDADKPVSTAQATAIGLKEDAANKSTSPGDSSSTTKFPVWSAIVSYFSASQIRSVLGISTLSGSNTGDETTSSIQTKRPLKTVNGNSLEGTGDVSITGGDTLVSEGALINSASSKATPVDADQVGLMDSAASNVLKKLSWANIKATLKTYFDTLYVDKTWKPVQIPIGAMLTSGATYAANTGAGIYISMSGGAADDSIFFNIHLMDGNGIAYDGSTIKLRIHARTSSNGVAADTVGLLLNYAFVKPTDNSMTKVTNVAQQNIDVSTRLQDIEFEVDLANMAGTAGDEILQVTIIRNSTGASADSYTGNFRITGIEIVKV
jgi:hypothetical protein